MSDNKFNLNISVPDSVDNAFKNITDSPTKEIGNIGGAIAHLIFGWLPFLSKKAKIKYKKCLEDYAEKINSKIEGIPDEYIQEPRVQIIGQAIESSKYCITEEILREMFSNLVSKTFDARYSDKILPSFADIIALMTPLDAENLQLFSNNKSGLPIAKYRLIIADDGSYIPASDHLLFENINIADYDLQSQSISSLERFGLVRCSYSEKIDGNDIYSKFHEGVDSFKKGKGFVQEIEIVKGSARLTALGESFINICVKKQYEKEDNIQTIHLSQDKPYSKPIPLETEVTEEFKKLLEDSSK